MGEGYVSEEFFCLFVDAFLVVVDVFVEEGWEDVVIGEDFFIADGAGVGFHGGVLWGGCGVVGKV